MREIKFRAWEKELKVMVHEGELCGYVEYDTNPVKAINLMLNGECDDYTFMQYTGLKDVNGTEIYEGDIIECFINGNSHVSFKGGVFGLIYDYSFIPFSDVHGEMKVIGNIYEDKHLLD